MSERTDAKWYGMDYVIAGRMVRLLTELRIAVDDEDSERASPSNPLTERSMKLWSIRNYVVIRYRTQGNVTKWKSKNRTAQIK